MANSPVPSTSKTPEIQNSSTPSDKKKKNRHRPRHKGGAKNKASKTDLSQTVQNFFERFQVQQQTKLLPRTSPSQKNQSISQSTESEVQLRIQKASIQMGRMFKKRNPTSSKRHINFESFKKDNTLGPCVFETTANLEVGQSNSADFLHRFNALTLSHKNYKQKRSGVSQTTSEIPHRNSDRGKKCKGYEKDPLEAAKKRNRKERRSGKAKTSTESNVKYKNYITEEELQLGLETGQLIKGAIRINIKNFNEAYVCNKDPKKSDYVIKSVTDRNRALDGDEVVLRAKNGESEKEMEVVYITSKVHSRLGIGFLKPIRHDREFAEFNPRDRRFPKMRIPKISWPSDFQQHPEKFKEILVLAKIGEWTHLAQAEGTILEILGLSKDLRIESLAILRELSLDPTPYDTAEIAEFLPKSQDITEEDLADRLDLRRECIFTIDPATARDLDDAMSCKRLPNGNYEIGVHISDASYFLRERTRLDEMVQNKATTIYLVDSTFHMLPVELCMHCSLLPGKDRLSFSVFWEFSPEGEILEERITRSIMNSCAQLSYEHAQTFIDENPQNSSTHQWDETEFPQIHNGYTLKDLCWTVNTLQKFAVILREKRVKNGALRIDQVKVYFSLDPRDGEPASFWPEYRVESHKLIEEFMLLANMTVAEWILKAYPNLAFLRLHEPPKQGMLEDLQRILETIGIHIDIASSGGIQSSLNRYITDDFLGLTRRIALSHLLAKPMQRAKYFCAGAQDEPDFSHYALSVPLYTHFTSPIRRYADIMVHRLLAASLGYRQVPDYTSDEVAQIANRCNLQKYNSKKASELSSELYLCHYVDRQAEPFIQTGVVVDVKDRCADVLVLKTGSVVRVYMNNLDDPGVKWEAEEIVDETNLTSPTNEGACKQNTSENNHNPSNPNIFKKMWKIIIFFPATKTHPQPDRLILELFSVVTVAITRKPNTNKLEAKLLRPQRSLVFNNVNKQ